MQSVKLSILISLFFSSQIIRLKLEVRLSHVLKRPFKYVL